MKVDDFISNIPKYIDEIREYSEKELVKFGIINIPQFDLDSFSLINAYLINKILNRESNSLLIKIPKEKEKKIYRPVLFSIIATLFFKNFVDNNHEYNIGDRVLKDHKSYKIIEIKEQEPKYILVSNYDDKNKTKIHTNSKDINNYIPIGNSNIKRINKINFNDYKELFNFLFGEITNSILPYKKFLYKVIIIAEKKDLFEILKKWHFNSINLRNAMPLKWVIRKGIDEDLSDNIPIEPMVYAMSDYDTFKSFVENKINEFDSIIIIGGNKYKDNEIDIRRCIREKIITKAIFIGNENIEIPGDLIEWKWTNPEINYFENVLTKPIEIIEVNEGNFIEKIKKFENYLNELKNKFCFSDISKLLFWSKSFYSFVLPDNYNNSRLKTKIEYIRNQFDKQMSNLMEDFFGSIDENPEEYINKFRILFQDILENIPINKFKKLQDIKNIDIIIVPDDEKGIWREEIDRYKLNSKNVNIISINDFIREEANYYSTVKNVFILTIFNLSKKFIKNDEFLKLFEKLFQNRHKINFILYAEEKLYLDKIEESYYKRLLEEYNSQYRLDIFNNIKFPIRESCETIQDKIVRLSEIELNEFAEIEEDFQLYEQIYYEIEFDNFVPNEHNGFENKKLIIESNKKVLLEQNSIRRKEQIYHLKIGDKIRLYENTDKKMLFGIARNNDKNGNIDDINKYSKLWKDKLKEYCIEKKINQLQIGNYNVQLVNDNAMEEHILNELLEELRKKGVDIKISTLRKWIDSKDDVLFPKNVKSLIAIKEIVNKKELNDSFDLIKKNKKKYNSIMIALGRDLSDELIDYIISNKTKKGEILTKFENEQIESFIEEAAPLKIIRNIKIVKDIENE